MDGSLKDGAKRARSEKAGTSGGNGQDSATVRAAAATISGVKAGKNKKKVRQAFDTPYRGSDGVQISPGSLEAQSAALAALSRLSNALSGRKSLANVFIFGMNAVCRTVEAENASKRIAACCITSPTPKPSGTRIAFGVGSPEEILMRHVALCCAQHKIPVVVLSETDSAELGRVVCMPSAFALALRPVEGLSSIEGLSKDVPTIAANVLEKLRAAQAKVDAPWLHEEFVGDYLPACVAPCLENPAREPQRQARAAELKQKQQQKKQKQQAQSQQPPAKKKR